MRRVLIISLTALMMVLFTEVTIAAKMEIKGADSFYVKGDGPISGWYWCRRPGHYAQWNWGPVYIYPKKAYINLNLLVTNKTNGGSGYSCTVKLVVLDRHGDVVETGSTKLYNPFRPQYSQNTQGIGYSAYGAYCLRHPSIIRKGFSIKIKWPPLNNRYHFAVIRNKAILAYTH